MRSLGHRPQTEMVWRQFARLDPILERLDITTVLAARQAGGTALATARNGCLACVRQRECRQRLESVQHACSILDFCPNAPFFRACRKAHG